MFFNLGGAEVLVIAMVALIAVGPEQLPGVMRKVGQFLAQARSMTAGLRDEFMAGMDEVTDMADPSTWMGSGTDDDPVVPRGYASKESTSGTGEGSAGDTTGQANEANPTFTSAGPGESVGTGSSPSDDDGDGEGEEPS